MLILEDKNRKLCCCNLSNREFKHLPVPSHLKYFFAVIYVSSPVSVGGGNKHEIGDYNLLMEIV